MLSVIIPTFNEIHLGYLKKTLQQMQELKVGEVFCIDGGSRDGTIDLIEKYGAKKIILPNSNRAMRLNEGIKRAQNSMVLLHHPRSFIEPSGLKYLLKNRNSLLWGGFRHKFDKNHPILDFTSWYSNSIRGKFKNILYLDHCIFAQKKLFNMDQPIPDVNIFEDTLLSLDLREEAKAQILNFYSTTSAIRFQKKGIYKQSFMNQILKLGFLFKVSDRSMDRIYEKNLSLNSHGLIQ